MNHTHILIAACLATFCGYSTAIAENVYIYSGSDQNPVEVKILNDVKNISFSETAITLTTANGEETPVALSDFDFFTFDKKETSGVTNITNVSHISVYTTGNILTVKSAMPIEKVEVYSTQATKLLDKSPRGTEFTAELAIPQGTYLVKVTTIDREEIHKIIKR